MLVGGFFKKGTGGEWRGNQGFPTLARVRVSRGRRMEQRSSRRSTGKLKCFDWELGSGFITPDGGGKDLLVQKFAIKPEDWSSIAEGQAVEFRVSCAGGNPKAIDVTRARGGGGGGGRSHNKGDTGRFDKECPNLNGGLNVIEIPSSSSEEDGEDGDDADEDDEEEEEEEEDGNESPLSAGMTVWTKEERKKEEEECCILGFDPLEPPTIDFKDKLSLANCHPSNLQDEDISVIAERGKVACRDYPHSRHLCVKYPFNKTDHESFCLQCYCYVCDAAAPCEFWKGSAGHCHASDQDKMWKSRRITHRGNLEDKVKGSCFRLGDG